MAYYFIQFDYGTITDKTAFEKLIALQQTAMDSNQGIPAFSPIDDYALSLINVEQAFNFGYLHHCYFFKRFHKYFKTLVPEDIAAFAQELDEFYAHVETAYPQLKAMYIQEQLLAPDSMSIKDAYDELRAYIPFTAGVFDAVTVEGLDTHLPKKIREIRQAIADWNRNNRKPKIYYNYQSFEDDLQDQLETIEPLRELLKDTLHRGGTGLILR